MSHALGGVEGLARDFLGLDDAHLELARESTSAVTFTLAVRMRLWSLAVQEWAIGSLGPLGARRAAAPKTSTRTSVAAITPIRRK